MKKFFFFAFSVALIASACGSNQSANQPAPLGGPAPVAIPGACKKISLTDARNMVGSYHKDSTQLKLSNGDTLVSFFIDRNALEDLLSKETNDGIRVYLAKNTETNDPTICIIGTQPDSLDSSIHNNAAGSIYEFVEKCPDVCNQRPNLELYQK
jgi:hypothetical protein